MPPYPKLYLVLSAFLIAAFIPSIPKSLAAPTSTPAVLSSKSIPDATATLSPGTLNKILQLIASKGEDGNVGAKVANALGMTAAGQPWADHKIAVASPDKVIHGFTISRGSDEDVIIYARWPDGIHIFRAHRDGKLVAALSFNPQTRMITTRDAAAARQELDDEFTFWTRSVDGLLAGE
jgi:hypothetical protein